MSLIRKLYSYIVVNIYVEHLSSLRLTPITHTAIQINTLTGFLHLKHICCLHSAFGHSTLSLPASLMKPIVHYNNIKLIATNIKYRRIKGHHNLANLAIKLINTYDNKQIKLHSRRKQLFIYALLMMYIYI